MNVYIHKPVNYSDMQGPCDSGFHVPTHDEWVGLKSIMESLSLSTSTGYSIYLHIPKCGQRRFTDGTVQGSGEARYTCCDGEILSNSSKYINGGLVIYNSTISTSVAPSVAGLSIRPFKNDTIVPDSSWTTIYQGTGSAGIFWNTSEGIISLSSDGTNWITIADKNCGATNVYNNGDTMSESNCGKFYQRGNNYGFPFTGSITTSSTQVDDSNYGPGNYYSSSNFITVSAAPYRWGTSDNLNLRGGVSGVGGESELKNAYIGEYDFAKYQEVEYIQSSGTQYIDTGYVLTSNPGCDIDFSFLGGDSNSRIPIYGSRNGGYYGDNTGNFCLYINSSSLYVTPNYAGFDPGTSSGVVISSNTKYNIVNDKGQFYLNGVLKTSASTTNTYVSSISRTFVLFGNNDYTGSVQIRGCRMKLYGCKLYNNGTLVRNFIPCYRKSDSVIGLYDLVNKQFYTNSGTGTFTKGADVN